MKKIKKSIILSLFFALCALNPLQAVENDSLLMPENAFEIHNTPKTNPNNSYFNLANIVDTIFTNEKSSEQENDEKNFLRKDFVRASSKFNQGNATAAYSEYDKLIDKTENDVSLLTLSKVFYEIGLFSLGDKAIEKIVYKNQFFDNINDLEKTFKPKANLNIDDEIYFAKIYSDIYFDNNAYESAIELSNKKDLYDKNDFYNYTLSRAYLEAKQYNNALSAINKAISANPENISYKILKTDCLIASGKYKEAKSVVEKLEKNKNIIFKKPQLEILIQTILAHTTKNDKEKKYYIANRSFLEGNFEKTKKDCQNILNFDKDNAKILSLYAKSELALGNVERANNYFVNSYKLDKNNIDTIIGLGDIRYIHGDYKNSVKMYKKAHKMDKDNYEIVLKLSNAQRQYAKNPKELKKLETLLDKMPKGDYLSYYKSAISIAAKNDVLKEDFLKRSLMVNPLYENALGELIQLNLKNKNFIAAKGLIQVASFTLEKNYYYYYLCGLYNQAANKRNDAIQFYKNALNLNPNFEVANIKLLKLIPNTLSEEI